MNFFNVIIFISLYIFAPYQQVDSPKAIKKPANEFPTKYTRKVCGETRATWREEQEERRPAVLLSDVATPVRAGWRGFIAVTLE